MKVWNTKKPFETVKSLLRNLKDNIFKSWEWLEPNVFEGNEGDEDDLVIKQRCGVWPWFYFMSYELVKSEGALVPQLWFYQVGLH